MEPTSGHGWNQQFRDLPYKPFRTGLRCTEGAGVGKGLDAGLAPLLEALGVPSWVRLFLIQEASMQGTSCDLVVTWHSTHILG